MSDENNEVATIEPAPFRISYARKNDLQKVLRRSDKNLEDAFTFLENLLQDAQADPKLKVEAAKFLIEKRIAISSEIAKDQLARVIGESRLLLAERATQQKRIKNVTDDDDNSDAQPVYLPNMILDHGTVKEM